MYDYIYTTVLTSKYLGIGTLMAFFPAEAIMPFVGYSASQGALSIAPALAAGIVGSTLGSTGVYLLARLCNPKAVGRFTNKHGAWLGLNDKRISRAGRMFDAHARSTVFFGRFIPGVRTAVSIPAGYQRMNIFSFMLYTALGSGISAGVLLTIGYFARQSINQTQTMANYIAYALGLVMAVIVVWIFVHRRPN